ncbi:MAG: YfhO family protein [Clostridiales bacterium]|nr:YfhO family protein [Clostridiales bacterium]
MQKIKKGFLNNKYVLLSGGISIFVILLVYFCFDIKPFGDGIIYRMDLYHQYGPLFTELYDRIHDGQSLIYSWTSGMGSSFIGNFYNYLSSPLTLIVLLLCGHKNTFEAVAALIAIKAVLSSMSMTYYFKKSQNFNSPVSAGFGVMYAFCAYFVAYYWNVMWIDSMYILPFVILGIERIIDKGKCKTFILSLIYCIFANYYIGYIICIFSVFYFGYYYICRFDELVKGKKYINNEGLINKIRNSFLINSGLRFAGSAVLVGLILSFMLIPLAFILKTSSATSGGFPAEHKFYYDIFDFLANHLASLEPTIRSSGDCVLPNVYCGMLTVILLPLYLFGKNINIKEKIASVALLIFMYFSFNLNYLNFVWHGFHFPNDLPYRQSFIYSFILIVLASKAFRNLRNYSGKEILLSGLAVAAFAVLVQKIGSNNVNNVTIYISLIFTVLLTVVLYLLKSKKNQAFALSFMLLCSITAETIAANTNHYVANQNKTSYVYDYDDFKDVQEKVRERDDSLFYREELSDLRARMDPSWYGYNGVSVFSSMAYETVAAHEKFMGLYGNNINSFTYNPNTPVYNALTGIKYVYDKSGKLSKGDYYIIAAENERYKAYENLYSLPIAFPVASETQRFDPVTFENPLQVHEDLFKRMTGVEGIYNHIYNYEIENSNISSISDSEKYDECLQIYKTENDFNACATIDYIADTEDNIYIYICSRNLGTVSVYSPTIDTTMDIHDGYILDLGKNKIGDTITIELPLEEDKDYASVDFCIFSVNKEKFLEGYEKLKDGALELTSFGDTYLEGTYSAEDNEILYTSIPYDSCWNVYIDGKRVSSDSVIAIDDAMLAVKTPKGKHKLSMSYTPYYYKQSVIFSTIVVVLVLIIYVLKYRKMFIWKKGNNNLWNRIRKAKIKAFSQDKNE